MILSRPHTLLTLENIVQIIDWLTSICIIRSSRVTVIRTGDHSSSRSKFYRMQYTLTNKRDKIDDVKEIANGMHKSFIDFSKQKSRDSGLNQSIHGCTSDVSLIDIDDSFIKKRPSSAIFKHQLPRSDIMIKRNSYYQNTSPSKEPVMVSLKKVCMFR